MKRKDSGPRRFASANLNAGTKVFIKTFGCQMNERDSEIISGMLRERGYIFTNSPEEADVVLFNTCSVREHAEARVWGQVGMLLKEGKARRLNTHPKPAEAIRNREAISKTQSRKYSAFHGADLSRGETRPAKIVGVVGCMAQNYKSEIFRRLPGVNLVCGTGNIYEIPNLIDKLRENGSRILAVDKPEGRPIDAVGLLRRKSSVSAWVSIMEGCNNCCSYCIVPYVRGRERSKGLMQILDEIGELIKRGYKEITLLGQNVNSYKGRDVKREGRDFIDLLREVDKTGIERVRFTTSHPKDASSLLFKAMANLPSLCEHLHLPVQSGSNRILKAMNRGYTREDYLRLINAYRKSVPEGSLTTDIIVGFPGECEADFRETMNLMGEADFDAAFIFKYSPRPHTRAEGFKDDVPIEVKRERNQILLGLQKEVSLKKNNLLKGKQQEVLIEGSAKDGGRIFGRTRTNKVVVLPHGNGLPGDLIQVKIEEVTAYTLIVSETESPQYVIK